MKNLFLFLLITLFNKQVHAQCADSMIDCTGQCGRYIDLNHDKFCDYSILSITKSIEAKDSVVIEKKPDNFIELPHKELAQKVHHHTNSVRPATEISKATKKDSVVAKSTILSSVNQNNKKPLSSQSPYHLLSIFIPLLIAAILMKILQVKNVIRNITYTRFWNVLLLISFLVTALLGMLLVVKINYGLEIPNLKYCYIFHVDFGIAMSIIAFIHFLWHWKYYYKLSKGK